MHCPPPPEPLRGGGGFMDKLNSFLYAFGLRLGLHGRCQQKNIKWGEGIFPSFKCPESVFLDEGQGASGGVSIFENFFLTPDQ